MGSLLIAAAVELGSDRWPDDISFRISGSLGLGLGGPVRSAKVDGALLFERSALRDAPPARRGSRLPTWVPYEGPDGAQVLFAGDIYDRNDLRAALPHPPSIQSDQAFYAAALAHFGDDCDRRINGNYAAIAWYPGQRRLRLARSAIDAPPLHVWREGNRLIAASTPRAMFAAGIDDTLDEAKLDDALYLNFRDPRRGWFRGISRVAPGEWVRHDRDGERAQVFWSFDVPPVRFPRDDDYVEALDEAFTRASSNMLDGFKAPAIQLSAGLDSQAVASYALDSMPEQYDLKAYTSVPLPEFEPLDWPGAFGDEGDLARAFAAMHPRIELETFDCDGIDMLDGLDSFTMLSSHAAMGAINMYWGHETFRRCRRDGRDVLLDGGFGNIGFSYDGLTAFPAWFRELQWGRLWREMRARPGKMPLWRRLISEAMMPNLPIPFRQKVALWRGHGQNPFDSWCALDKTHALASGVFERARKFGHDALFLDPGSARAWRESAMAMSLAEAGDATLALELLHGIPSRSPAGYRPLMELCAGMPEDQYLRNGETRWLARRLLRGRVPEAVRTNRKMGIQSADWPVRWRRQREQFLSELDMLQLDRAVASQLDLSRLRRNLMEWSGQNSVGGPEGSRVYCAVSRGLVAARFRRSHLRKND